MKILFLTSWYPHRYDAMMGLFVRKHAEAVARLSHVCVLYMHEDEHITQTEITEHTDGNLTEIIVYYPKQGNSLTAFYHYFQAAGTGFRYVRKNWGMPDLTHANIFLKPALMAYFLQRKYGIPYVVTEHWSGYLPANGAYARLSAFHRYLTRLTAKKAAAVLPVSLLLQKNMERHNIHANYQVVNNVVDDFFYQKPPQRTFDSKKHLLHISCFDEAAKNTKGILAALKQVSQQRQDFDMVFVGTGVNLNDTVAYTELLGFPDGMVQFVGEQTPEEVAQWLYRSDCLIIFSNYETACVVVSEALATGTPVIATEVGSIPQMIDNQSGIIIQPKDIAALTRAINYMLDHSQDYDSGLIQTQAQQYSYAAVAGQLISIYRQALS